VIEGTGKWDGKRGRSSYWNDEERRNKTERTRSLTMKREGKMGHGHENGRMRGVRGSLGEKKEKTGTKGKKNGENIDFESSDFLWSNYVVNHEIVKFSEF
jgi:hypothetical protein